ncbi:hypothetical protein ACFLZI_00400 [Nitrospirota bacterium]
MSPTVWASATAVNETKLSDFATSPVEHLKQIYTDYHNWNIDRGIETASAALITINKMYSTNPEATLNDKALRLNKAYQVKSTLHTLRGMLYYRKSTLEAHNPENSDFKEIMDKLKDGKELTEEDLEQAANKAENSPASSAQTEYYNLAIKEFEQASHTDPGNPSPHYQLGTIYKAVSLNGDTAEAENQFYMALKLSSKEGDSNAARRAYEALLELNPSSPHLQNAAAIMSNK